MQFWHVSKAGSKYFPAAVQLRQFCPELVRWYPPAQVVHVVPELQAAQLLKQGLHDWVAASYHVAPEHWMQLPDGPKLYPDIQVVQVAVEAHVWQFGVHTTQVPELKYVPDPQGVQVPALNTYDG